MPPKVTIVIPTYNRALLLRRALMSARAQTYPRIEIIVVDDSSTDGTPEVVAEFGDTVRYVRGFKEGCAGAKNRGLAAASGELITNLDDDDLFLPEKVERQVEFLVRTPQAGICGTGVEFMDQAEHLMHVNIPPPLTRRSQILRLLRGCPFVQSSVMIRRECHERLGGYRLIRAEDYDFWLRVALHYEVGVLPELLTRYRRHSSQMTSPENNREQWESVRRIVREFLAGRRPEEICPGSDQPETVYAAVGAILLERKFPEEAESFLRRALPGHDARFWLGMLCLRRKEFTAACRELDSLRDDEVWGDRAGQALRIAAEARALEGKLAEGRRSPSTAAVRTAARSLLRGAVDTQLGLLGLHGVGTPSAGSWNQA